MRLWFSDELQHGRFHPPQCTCNLFPTLGCLNPKSHLASGDVNSTHNGEVEQCLTMVSTVLLVMGVTERQGHLRNFFFFYFFFRGGYIKTNINVPKKFPLLYYAVVKYRLLGKGHIYSVTSSKC